MGIRYARLTLQDRANQLRNVPIASLVQLRKQMEFIAEQGAQSMQDTIRRSETSYGRYRFNELGQGRSAGREDTGTMFDDVGWRVVSPVPAVINAEFGWLDEFLKYFGYQERGTEFIEPMLALRDASDEARAQFKLAAEQMIADAAKKIGKI